MGEPPMRGLTWAVSGENLLSQGEEVPSAPASQELDGPIVCESALSPCMRRTKCSSSVSTCGVALGNVLDMYLSPLVPTSREGLPGAVASATVATKAKCVTAVGPQDSAPSVRTRPWSTSLIGGGGRDCISSGAATPGEEISSSCRAQSRFTARLALKSDSVRRDEGVGSASDSDGVGVIGGVTTGVAITSAFGEASPPACLSSIRSTSSSSSTKLPMDITTRFPRYDLFFAPNLSSNDEKLRLVWCNHRENSSDQGKRASEKEDRSDTRCTA